MVHILPYIEEQTAYKQIDLSLVVRQEKRPRPVAVHQPVALPELSRRFRSRRAG